MKTSIICVSAFFLTLFSFLMPAPTFACALDDSAPLTCNPRQRWAGSQVLIGSIAATPTPESIIPSGASPAEARDVPNEWQVLEPRASVWYKTAYSDNFRMLEYWLETNLPDVASFAVYAPQQSEDLSPATKPVGRGTHNKKDPDNIIRWVAGYAWPGTWYLLLTNNSDQPVSYKLNHNQETVPTKTCISYWEPLNGVMVLWTDCGRYGPPK